ncbi:hypothetical protein DB347_09200 [Opitutaceae bacterium EW11]|nr:hypothetical protein DB347_09200 [Opitutaceae bacterium EW11]
MLGARAWQVEHYVSAVPFWDQWNGEAMDLFRPYLRGTLGWGDFFRPHNEHRIVLTRLLSLGLFIANGRLWDPKLEMLVNSAGVAALAVALQTLLARSFPPKSQAWISAVQVCLWASPYGWENSLAGFQSQVYLMLALSVFAVWMLATTPVFGSRWWLGLAAAALACLSMGSGFLAASAVVVVRTALLLRPSWISSAVDTSRKTGLWTLGTCAAIAVLGAALVQPVAAHEVLKAENPYRFFKTLAHGLSWPLPRIPIAFLVFYLPAFGVCVRAARGVRPLSPVSVSAWALVAWTVLQALAIAYGRGAHGHMPTSRYQDLLAIGCAANGLLLLDNLEFASRRLLRAWTALFFVGIAWATVHELRHLPAHKVESEEQLARCSLYLATGDIDVFTQAPSPRAVPYPDPLKLARFLDDPTVRSFLPFAPENASRSGRLSPLSAFVIRHSTWLAAAGTIVWLASLRFLLQQNAASRLSPETSQARRASR